MTDADSNSSPVGRSEVRQWAIGQGVDLPPRGALPAGVITRWNNAHPNRPYRQHGGTIALVPRPPDQAAEARTRGRFTAERARDATRYRDSRKQKPPLGGTR